MTPSLSKLTPKDALKLSSSFGAAMVVNTVTGFGGALLFMPLGMQVVPSSLDLVAGTMVPYMGNSILILLGGRDKVDFRLIFLRVLPWSALGMGAGMKLAKKMAGNELKKALGVFLLSVAFSKIYELFRQRDQAKKPPSPVPISGLLLGGLIQGIYGTGGPPIVWALARANLERDVFLNTSAAIWVFLGVIQLAGLRAAGNLNSSHVKLSAVLFPGMIAGTILGTILQKRVPEHEARILLYAMLAGSGIMLLK